MPQLLFSSFFAAICLGVLADAIRRSRQTTLLAPLTWAAISVVTIWGVEVACVVNELKIADYLRYVASVSSFCPTMAVFGAKRPQDRAWKFIVGSLWIVLVLPAVQALIFAYGDELELHWAWQLFLFLLVLAGTSNYLLTDWWFSSLACLVAQSVLLIRHLGLPVQGLNSWAGPLGLGFFAFAGVTAWIGSRRPRRNGLDRVWLDFRDAFGAIWGIRIMERVNALAEQEAWMYRLTWSGFVPVAARKDYSASMAKDGDTDNIGGIDQSEYRDAAERCLRTLLRRFVDPAWIERRLN